MSNTTSGKSTWFSGGWGEYRLYHQGKDIW